LGGGYYHNLAVSDANGLIGEAYLSRYLSPTFDLMANLNLGYTFSSLSSNEKANADLGNLFLNLRYKLNNGKILPVDNKLQPFIYAGPGYLSDNKKTGLNFDAGVGAKYMLSKSWSLFAEAGYIQGIDGLRSVDKNGVIVEESCHDDFFKAAIGIEWAFSAKIDKDKDGVADFKDKCPNTPKGTKVDKTGCPIDSDGDGIADSDDKCPKVKGLIAFNGCPDTDGDGIIDGEDDCPDVKGTLAFKGCPDTDGDGIMDSKDDCPTVKGVKEFKGCPDTDGDGIADKEDECPTVFGIKAFNGCPDSDEDGVADKSDACPNTPKDAKVDAKGCPIDSDGDGIFDGIDKCPDVKGVLANKGCPLEESKVKWLKDIKVNSIFFATNSSEITTDSKQRMEKLLRLMENNADYNVNIFGFADQRGNPDANKALSMRRAKAAVQYLISKGIAESRFSTEALGEENTNKASLTEEELQNSRRVDFNLYK